MASFSFPMDMTILKCQNVPFLIIQNRPNGVIILLKTRVQTSAIRTNLGRVSNSRRVCVHALQSHCFETKQLNLKLKARHKQLLGYLPLYITLQKSYLPRKTHVSTYLANCCFGRMTFVQMSQHQHDLTDPAKAEVVTINSVLPSLHDILHVIKILNLF